MRILVVDFNFLGDMLMNSPAIKALHDYGNDVNVLCHDFSSVVAAANPYTKSVYSCGRSRREKFEEARLLRHLDYDLSIQFNTSLETNVLMKIIGAKKRMGYSYKWCGYGLTDPIKLPHRTLTVGNRINEVCSLVERGLGYEVKDRRMIFEVKGKFEVPDRNFIVIHCNTRNTQWLRRWDGFKELALKLFHQFGWTIYYTGTWADKAYVETNIPYINAVNLCGKTSIQQLASLIQQAGLVITVNTFTMHLAIALGSPTIALIGGTDSEVVCPKNNPKFRHIQADGLDMSKITVGMVMEKIKDLQTSLQFQSKSDKSGYGGK